MTTPEPSCTYCRGGRHLVEEMAAKGIEVHVQPYNVNLKQGEYQVFIATCPRCRADWWMEPTNDQILKWTEDRVG